MGVNTVYGKMGPGGSHVGKNARRATEDVVFDFNPLIHRYIILYPNTVSNVYIGTDIDILSQGAAFAQYGTRLNMAEVPHLGSPTQGDPFVHIGAFVYVWFVYHPNG